MSPTINGMLKSWTAWFGALLIGLPELWPLIAPQVQELVGPQHYPRLLQIIGIIVIVLRFKTRDPLREKGEPKEFGFVRLSMLPWLALTALLIASCAGQGTRNLYVDLEIGLKNGYGLVEDLSTRELAARAAGKPAGSIITRAQADKRIETLDAAKIAGRLAIDTTSGCVQPMNSEAASALQRLGLSGCVTSDQALIAALAAVRLLRENLESPQ